MDCTQEQRSRPALVERTNSTEELNEVLIQPYKPAARSAADFVEDKTVLLEEETSSEQSVSSDYSYDEVNVGDDEVTVGDDEETVDEEVTVEDDSSTSCAAPASSKIHYHLENGPAWMVDSTLSNTSVFHIRLNRPAVMIQAIARGMIQRKKYRQERIARLKQAIAELEYHAVSIIQAQVRGMQQRKHYALCRAAIPMQAAVRGWVCRMKLQANSLQKRLDNILTSHQRELEEIELNKQFQMKRFYEETKAAAAKEKRDLEKGKEEVEHLIEDLRENNTKLRKQNETLRQANSKMAQKNKETMQLTLKIYENIKEVKKALPQIQADHDHLQKVNSEFEQCIKQYQEALATCEERHETEKEISYKVVSSVRHILDRMQESDSINKELAAVMSKSAYRNIRIAQKQQAKSNKAAKSDSGASSSKS